MPFDKPSKVRAHGRKWAKLERRHRAKQAMLPRTRMTKRRRAKTMKIFFWEQVSIIKALMPVGENFDPRVDDIKTIPMRKQLLFSLLDSMAMLKARIDDLPNFKARASKRYFIDFVSTMCGWKNHDRVSIPVLIKRFEMEKRKKRPTTRKSFMAYLRKVQREHPDQGRDVRSSEIDPRVDDLLKPAKTDVEKRIVRKTTMAMLLYGLRNSRLHQMRNQGDGVDGFAHITDEPVYQSFNDEEELHLVFPQQFVIDLVLAGADGLERHSNEKKVDPYNFLPDNSAWELEDDTPNKKWKRTRGRK
jgi:hypothetical protein